MRLSPPSQSVVLPLLQSSQPVGVQCTLPPASRPLPGASGSGVRPWDAFGNSTHVLHGGLHALVHRCAGEVLHSQEARTGARLHSVALWGHRLRVGWRCCSGLKDSAQNVFQVILR